MKKCSQSVQLIEKMFFLLIWEVIQSVKPQSLTSGLSVSSTIFKHSHERDLIFSAVFPISLIATSGLHKTRLDLREIKSKCRFRVESAEKKPKGIDVARMWNWIFGFKGTSRLLRLFGLEFPHERRESRMKPALQCQRAPLGGGRALSPLQKRKGLSKRRACSASTEVPCWMRHEKKNIIQKQDINKHYLESLRKSKFVRVV